jgi:hypothetical protein
MAKDEKDEKGYGAVDIHTNGDSVIAKPRIRRGRSNSDLMDLYIDVDTLALDMRHDLKNDPSPCAEVIDKAIDAFCGAVKGAIRAKMNGVD